MAQDSESIERGSAYLTEAALDELEAQLGPADWDIFGGGHVDPTGVQFYYREFSRHPDAPKLALEFEEFVEALGLRSPDGRLEAGFSVTEDFALGLKAAYHGPGTARYARFLEDLAAQGRNARMAWKMDTTPQTDRG